MDPVVGAILSVGLSGIGCLISVLLMTKASLEDFTKKIMLSMPGLLISMVGFLLAYSVMVQLF